MATTDWTRLLDRLDPRPDGETPLRHRSGTVDALNSDGTIDVDISGVVVTVNVLAGAPVEVGDVVQIVAWSGDLLALGRARDDATLGIGGLLVHSDSEINTANGSSTTAYTSYVTLNVPDLGVPVEVHATGWLVGQRTSGAATDTTRLEISIDGTSPTEPGMRQFPDQFRTDTLPMVFHRSFTPGGAFDVELRSQTTGSGAGTFQILTTYLAVQVFTQP